ncbi:unnamed protein product [Blepharisma stoltei]|uniref:RING-type domain-containing protein n=1 Tax=Blepharisma stoltei TaxID=1481888 RepID=A0AAU9KEG1_9CILI|nr:unnamed protein product [Blepharisma stoltei]
MEYSTNSLIATGSSVIALLLLIFFFLYFYCRRYYLRLNELRRRATADQAGQIFSNNGSVMDELSVQITDAELNKIMPALFFPPKQKFKGEPACSICLVDFKAGETLRLTKCKHIFHVSCIDEWIITSRKKKCPNCNMVIVK